MSEVKTTHEEGKEILMVESSGNEEFPKECIPESEKQECSIEKKEWYENPENKSVQEKENVLFSENKRLEDSMSTSEINFSNENSCSSEKPNKITLSSVSPAFMKDIETKGNVISPCDLDEKIIGEMSEEQMGDEDFKGFPELAEEISNHDLIKNLSQREENELQEMEVLAETSTEVRLSPYSKRKRREIEESDLSSHCSSPALSVTSQLSMLSFTKRSRTGSPASRGSRKSTVDLTNPKYLLPFNYGWKREVVTRAITSKEDGISKDVYYFHPSGKKLRSLREVSEKLTPGLTIENFTFYKEPLGADTQFETIRNARTRGFSPFEPIPLKSKLSPEIAKTRVEAVTSSEAVTPVEKIVPLKESLPVKDSLKNLSMKNFVKTPKDSSAKSISKREKLVLKFNKGTPKIALKKTPAVNGERKSPRVSLEGAKPHPNAPSGPRRKITPRKKLVKAPNEKEGAEGNADEGDMEMGMLPPLWSPTDVSNKSSSNDSLSWSHLDEDKSINEEGRLDPCTISCTKAMGLIPTLQCSLCLCLYHPECCDSSSASSKYVCKNCQAKVHESKSKNLVKHITPALVSDKNCQIISPKAIHPPSTTVQASPASSRSLHVRSKFSLPKTLPVHSSAWLPPSSSLFKAPVLSKTPQTKAEELASSPQALVTMNDRKYIIVPKNNVLSVASPQNLSPSRTDSVQNTTIITPTPTSTIIHGPPLYNNPLVQPSVHPPGVVLVRFMSGERVSQDPMAHSFPVSAVNPVPSLSATPSGLPDLPTGTETAPSSTEIYDKTIRKFVSNGGNEFMQKFMRNICIGYSALLNVFQYLKVQELLRAGRVCRLWRDLAGHSSLWQTVRMKNSQVSDWKGFTDSLSRHGTKHLDLRKMLMSVDDAEESWTMFARHICNVKCLERLDMCRCSVNVVAQIMEACPHLLVFNAQMIGVKDQALNQKLSLESVSKMKSLKELRLKSFFGLHLTGTLKGLIELSETLTTLSLTSVKNLGACDIQHIGQLKNLEALELGECCDLPETFPNEVIAELSQLKRIRLEKGPWNCSTNEMLYQMSKLKDLTQLELINFDIRPGFDKALATCTNIKRLLLIPTYVTQSATTNNIILSGTYKLWKSLTHFVWVVTMELLKVTELFVDQCEGKGSKKAGGNSVPVLKPVPLPEIQLNQTNEILSKVEENEKCSKNSTPITVIPIDELYDMLTEALPTTKVKLLKIPFQNTWRQSITEVTTL